MQVATDEECVMAGILRCQDFQKKYTTSAVARYCILTSRGFIWRKKRKGKPERSANQPVTDEFRSVTALDDSFLLEKNKGCRRRVKLGKKNWPYQFYQNHSVAVFLCDFPIDPTM